MDRHGGAMDGLATVELLQGHLNSF